jgi:transcription elongation factor Elf1
MRLIKETRILNKNGRELKLRIKKITSQHRRDFSAIYECEGCGNVEISDGGYDDRYYHDNVIPNMKCGSCGKSRNDLGIKAAEETQTKYPSWMSV